MLNKNLHLSSTQREEFSRAALLYMMIERKQEIEISLPGAHRALKEVVQSGLSTFWEEGKKFLEVTRKGEMLWDNWKARWWDCIVNFDVYAGVDLQEGRFAEPGTDFSQEDENGNLIWEDLRVAVCLRKIQLIQKNGGTTALSPFAIIFLSQLSEGKLLHSREWQFDIAFDSIFWSEIENIVNSQLWPEELGFEGSPWEDVIDDIIRQGTAISESRHSQNKKLATDLEQIPDEDLENEEDVRKKYGDELEEYHYEPGYFYPEPYWGWRDTAMTVGAIGLCWAIFS